MTDEFKIDWFTYLTSSENVIFAQVDGRGSGGRGTEFLHEIYRRFGTIEVQDQITAARYHCVLVLLPMVKCNIIITHS